MPEDVNSAKISPLLALCSNLLSNWWILITVSNLSPRTGLLTPVHRALSLLEHSSEEFFIFLYGSHRILALS